LDLLRRGLAIDYVSETGQPNTINILLCFDLLFLFSFALVFFKYYSSISRLNSHTTYTIHTTSPTMSKLDIKTYTTLMMNLKPGLLAAVFN
jgi:hypothetical protein